MDHGGPWILRIDADNFPICLAVINHTENTQNFDLSDLADFSFAETDLAHVQRVVVAAHFFWETNIEEMVRVLPGSWNRAVVEEHVASLVLSQIALLVEILLDGVASLGRRDLKLVASASRDLADVIDDALFLVRPERQIVPQRDLDVVIVVLVRLDEEIVLSERTLVLELDLFSNHFFNIFVLQ